MQKALNRDKVISVKLNARTYEQCKQLADKLDLMTSTMAYLIIRKYLADHVDDTLEPKDFNLL